MKASFVLSWSLKNTARDTNEVARSRVSIIPKCNCIHYSLVTELITSTKKVLIVPTIIQKGMHGAGQELFNDSIKDTDPSGNILFNDIGLLLKRHIEKYFKERSLDVRFKYIDPSYMIRGVPANPHDSIYCAHLAQNSVHAAMAGKTGVAMGCWRGHYVHVPIDLAVAGRKQVDPKGDLCIRR
jgi:6-phosphofructokinase